MFEIWKHKSGTSTSQSSTPQMEREETHEKRGQEKKGHKETKSQQYAGHRVAANIKCPSVYQTNEERDIEKPLP